MPPRIKTSQEMLGLKEFTELSFYRALGAEFLGTLFLVFVGCCAAISIGSGTVQTALAFGLAQAIVVQAMGHVSGAHINPAVSAGFLVARCISFSKFLMYVIVQVLGAIAASGIVFGMIPENLRLRGVGLVMKADLMSDAQAFGMELVVSFIFVFVVMGSTDDRRKDITGSVALNIGLALTAVILASARFSGAGINPARCIAPLIVMSGEEGIEEVWKNHWVYWIGPILGGVLASLVYSYCCRATKEKVINDDDSDADSQSLPIEQQVIQFADSSSRREPPSEDLYQAATTPVGNGTQSRQRGQGPPPGRNSMYPGARGGRGGRPMDNRGYMSDDNRFSMHN